MIPYDNEEETLITVDGIPYVAVPSLAPADFKVIACSECALHPSRRSVHVEGGCGEMPCTPARRKDRLDVVFKEATDVLLR